MLQAEYILHIYTIVLYNIIIVMASFMYQVGKYYRVYFANSLHFISSQRSEENLKFFAKKRRNAKENFTYKNHLKFSKFCSPELELQI